MGHQVLELEKTEGGLKILEFILDWLEIKLSIGTIARCIREAGIACEPVAQELLAQLSHGTRTNEGSIAYSCLLSVIETCRLRQVNPWTYIAEVIRLARKGLSPPKFPVTA